MTFQDVAAAIGNALKEQFEVEVVPTNGAEDNMKLLCLDKVDLGLVHASTKELRPGITSIMNLFTSTLHIITSDPKIAKITDIGSDTRVILAPEGSGTAMLGKKLLEFYGIKAHIVPVNTFLNARDSLIFGKADVVFVVGGIPVDFLNGLINKYKYHLVSIPNPAAVSRVFPFLKEDFIPYGVYGGLKLLPDTNISIVSVNTVLVASPEFSSRANSSHIVERITKLIFDNRQELIESHPAMNFLNKTFAIEEPPFPLHPGAYRVHYRERTLLPLSPDLVKLLTWLVSFIVTVMGAVIGRRKNRWSKWNNILRPIWIETLDLLDELNEVGLSKNRRFEIYRRLLVLKNDLLRAAESFGTNVKHTEPVRDVITEAIRRAKYPFLDTAIDFTMMTDAMRRRPKK